MKRFTAASGALVATGAALLGTLALAGPAAAKSKCPKPHSSLAPQITYPCNGAVIKRGSKVKFKVYDPNSLANRYQPYLNLQVKRSLTKGHLKADSSGKGIFQSLKGHNTHWGLTEGGNQFAGYWSDTPGTYYLQAQQIDSRAGIEGVFYSPIITIHVR